MRDHRDRAQSSGRYVRVGCGLLGQNDGRIPRGRPRDARGDHARLPPLGRHRRSLQGAHDHLRRPRLLRDRAHRPAADPATASARAGRRAAVPYRGDQPGRLHRRLRSRRRVGRCLFHHAQAIRVRLPAEHSDAAESLHLARQHHQARCLHVRLREDGRRLVQSARLPLRRRVVDRDRGDARAHLARCGDGSDGAAGVDRDVRDALPRSTAAAIHWCRTRST